jgi:hypothetical protein
MFFECYFGVYFALQIIIRSSISENVEQEEIESFESRSEDLIEPETVFESFADLTAAVQNMDPN